MRLVIVEGDINCDSDNTTILSGVVCDDISIPFAVGKLKTFLLEKFEFNFPESTVALTVCLSHSSLKKGMESFINNNGTLKLEFVLNNGDSAGVFEFSHQELNDLAVIHLSSSYISIYK